MSGVGRYHKAISELTVLERQLLIALAADEELLNERQEALIRWALTSARMVLFRTPGGYDVELAPLLKPFRHWLGDALRAVISSSGKVDGLALRSLCPSISHRLEATRKLVFARFVNDFGSEHLDAEIRHKKLALVLGGGGGSALAHLSIFSMFEHHGVKPSYIVGTSMGALLGLFRAIEPDYDPIKIATSLPRSFDLGSLFSPFTGRTRFGFPGAFHLQLIRVAREALNNFVGDPRIPTFEDLPIRFEVVSTGIRMGFHASEALERRIQEAGGRSFTPLAMGRRIRLFFHAVKELSANPKLLRQVVFGRDGGTRDFSVVEAIGFSCSVPGLFNYDVFHDDPKTISTLEDLFEQHRLWRLTDGGIVNNVPSRVAWESVMLGNLGTRNVFIFAADPFAPTGANLIFAPMQQIARPAVLANRPFSDFHKTFKSAPGPANLSPGFSKLKRIQLKATRELMPDEPYLKKVLEPLPPYGHWGKVI